MGAEMANHCCNDRHCGKNQAAKRGGLTSGRKAQIYGFVVFGVLVATWLGGMAVMMVRSQADTAHTAILKTVDDYKNKVQPGLLKSVENFKKVGNSFGDLAKNDKKMRDSVKAASTAGVHNQPEAAALASLASAPLAPPGSILLDFGVQLSGLSSSQHDKFTVLVHPEWAPLGAARLIELVKQGFYSETRFFRVVPNFMVQWGISGDPATSAKW